MSETPAATAVLAPTIYFIDDSATMREVIKIAFRKENIQVVTCPSVSAAIEQFGTVKPDAVISDVIMPDRDGYELCTYIKGRADLEKTPVILMSGVVNRTVAEKATLVGANELLRKPFQPQELVARVKKLLPGAGGQPESTSPETAAAPAPGASGMNGLEKLFTPSAPAVPPIPAKLHVPPAPAAAPIAPKAPAAPVAAPVAAPPRAPASPAAPAAAPPAPARSAAPPAAAVPADVQRLRFEIQRLELLVKKLQSELEAERQYCQALEAHLRALDGGA
ncbi:MAG TPA: response regulator [Candidatus Acidoferrales bacterium]|nr:response regulator [Candidatus Acidoferrales bacterium]